MRHQQNWNQMSETLREVLEPVELQKNNELLQQELSASQHFLTILRWKMGDIESLTSSCRNSVHMKTNKGL